MSDEEEGYRPAFGGGGLGFRAATVNDESDDDQQPSGGGGLGFRPPVAFQQTMEDEGEHEDAPPAKKMKFNKSMGGWKIPGSSGQGGATSGFAARMMAKMGYKEGQGLGTDGRGRLAPIDAQLRPQGAGLGAVREKTKQAKEEEKRAAAFRGEKVEDSSEEERKRKKEAKKKRQQQALSGIGTSQRKSKTRYRTAAEIEQESAGLEVPNVLKSLIDVTGKDTEYGAGASGVMVPQETEAAKIAKRARRDLEAFAEEWSNLKEQKSNVDLESEQLVTDVDDKANDTRHIQEIVHAVELLQGLALQSDSELRTEQWEAVISKLENLETQFIDDFARFGIHEVAVSAVHPLFKVSMANWAPLKEPEHLVGYLQRLQFVLGVNGDQASADTMTVRSKEYISIRPNKKSTSQYETMIYTLWLPAVRSAITNDWNVEQPEPLERLLRTWKPLLPAFVLNHVVVQLLVPRLISALAAWKPGRSDGRSNGKLSSPPHHWLFPWLDILPPSQLDSHAHDGLATELRRKVRSLLSRHDITSGAPTWLPPLRSELLPDRVYATVTTSYLPPSLASYLDTSLNINPSDQDMDSIDHSLECQPLFKAESFAELLVATFFPKFFKTLHLWLTAEPNYNEIRLWFQWWMQQIPEALNGLPRIARQWDAALEMINVAKDLGQRAKRKLPQATSFLHEDDRSQKEKQREHRRERKDRESRRDNRPAKAEVEPEITFRDVVEEHCAELGLLFMSLREAHPDNGAALLRITANPNGKGGIVCYIQGDLLYKRSKQADPNIGVEQTTWQAADWQKEMATMAGA